jgi:hypothetical protein
VRSLGRTVPAVLLAFVSSAVLPRAAFVLHTHERGEHVHVHAEEDLAHGHPHAHAHAQPDSHPETDGPSLAASDPRSTAHVHWQHPYQRADRPAPAALARAEVTRDLLAFHLAERPAPSAGPIRSRGPPVSA